MPLLAAPPACSASHFMACPLKRVIDQTTFRDFSECTPLERTNSTQESVLIAASE